MSCRVDGGTQPGRKRAGYAFTPPTSSWSCTSTTAALGLVASLHPLTTTPSTDCMPGWADPDWSSCACGLIGNLPATVSLRRPAHGRGSSTGSPMRRFPLATVSLHQSDGGISPTTRLLPRYDLIAASEFQFPASIAVAICIPWLEFCATSPYWKGRHHTQAIRHTDQHSVLSPSRHLKRVSGQSELGRHHKTYPIS